MPSGRSTLRFGRAAQGSGLSLSLFLSLLSLSKGGGFDCECFGQALKIRRRAKCRSVSSFMACLPVPMQLPKMQPRIRACMLHSARPRGRRLTKSRACHSSSPTTFRGVARRLLQKRLRPSSARYLLPSRSHELSLCEVSPRFFVGIPLGPVSDPSERASLWDACPRRSIAQPSPSHSLSTQCIPLGVESSR